MKPGVAPKPYHKVRLVCFFMLKVDIRRRLRFCDIGFFSNWISAPYVGETLFNIFLDRRLIEIPGNHDRGIYRRILMRKIIHKLLARERTNRLFYPDRIPSRGLVLIQEPLPNPPDIIFGSIEIAMELFDYDLFLPLNFLFGK